MRQYYVAVGGEDVKLATLVDLLQALFANGKPRVVVCVESRDALDDVICSLESTQQDTVLSMFSSLTMTEKESIVSEFRKENEDAAGGRVLVTTEYALSCLKAPVGIEVLLNYDLPTTKECLHKRSEMSFGASKDRGVVVNFAVAGTMDAFREYERICDQCVEAMPLHVADIFTERF